MRRSTRKRRAPANFDQQEPVGREQAEGQAPSSSEELSTSQEIPMMNMVTSHPAAPEVPVTALRNPTVSSDPEAALEQPTKGSSWYSSVFLVMNAALGGGILNFPQAYQQAGGIIIAVITQADWNLTWGNHVDYPQFTRCFQDTMLLWIPVLWLLVTSPLYLYILLQYKTAALPYSWKYISKMIFLVFIVAALFILASCSDMTGATTYQDVVRTVCGCNAQRASAVFFTLYCFGIGVTSLIIIGDKWEEFFLFVAKKVYCETPPWYMGRTSTITITSIILILPMCFPKRIDFLKYTCFVGVIGILYVVFMVTLKYFLPHSEPGQIKTKPDTRMGVFHIVATTCFAYQCHVSVIPIYSCMEPRNLKQFSKTISLDVIILVAMYTVTAVFGYLTFGDQITSNILLSYDPDVIVTIAVILIAVKTYTSYPIPLFCGRAAFDCLWTDFRGLSASEIVEQELLRRLTITPVWFTVTFILAIFVPNIGIVIAILGAVAVVLIYIFPGMCLLASTIRTVKESHWTGRKRLVVVFSCCFITVGVLIFGLILAQSIMNFTPEGIKADKSDYTC